jgi:excisionase family DNA binding protein
MGRPTKHVRKLISEGELRAFRTDRANPRSVWRVWREGVERYMSECTIAEAAALLSVSVDTVARLIKRGRLTARKRCGGRTAQARWRVVRADVGRIIGQPTGGDA